MVLGETPELCRFASEISGGPLNSTKQLEAKVATLCWKPTPEFMDLPTAAADIFLLLFLVILFSNKKIKSLTTEDRFVLDSFWVRDAKLCINDIDHSCPHVWPAVLLGGRCSLFLRHTKAPPPCISSDLDSFGCLGFEGEAGGGETVCVVS